MLFLSLSASASASRLAVPRVCRVEAGVLSCEQHLDVFFEQ